MKPDGGPAYPCWNNPSIALPSGGMSLRDRFATAALTNLAATPVRTPSGSDWKPAAIAEWCYQLADAMLIEREK